MSATQKTPEQIGADVIESHDVGSVRDLAGLSEVHVMIREAIEADRKQRSTFDVIQARYQAGEITLGQAFDALDDRSRRPERAGYEFAPDGDEDTYRDLWNENLPRVSGCMYFAIPGEQPIHVTDEQALHIMTFLAEENR